MRSDKQVGALVRARREQLGLTRKDVGVVDVSTVDVIENGRRKVKRSTEARYMHRLGWPADALDQLRDGEPTDVLAGADVLAALDADPLLDDDAREQVKSFYRFHLSQAAGRHDQERS